MGRQRLAACLSLFGLALAFLLFASAARAQSEAQPTQLKEVLLVSQSPTEAKFRLVFEPKANGFGVVVGDPARPALGLALTTRGNAALTPVGLKGLVQDLSFDQVDTVLILRFATARPATLKASAISDSTLEVVVSTGEQERKKQDDALASGPLPQASTPPPGEDGYELVMLKYADVSEVVGILTDGQTIKSNDVFIPREPAFGSNSLTGGAAYNPVPTNQPQGGDDSPLGQSVNSAIAVDRRLNAVWLKGSPEAIARLKAQIALVDIPVDSVILETELVELTESGAKAIGIDFTNANGQVAVATFQSGQFIPIGEQPNAGGHFSTGGNEVGGNLNSVGLQAAIYAQVQKGQGKILSRPRIAAQSGAAAKIITGDALPILTSITLSGVNGVSQQVQYVNVGVTLQIAPRVSDDGFVSSHVFCVVSSVTGYSQGYPTISQREAETTTTVRDGDSFVIGGLTQESTISSRTKIPLLGDIPLVGQAFRTDRSTKSRTELYIVVTPHIVRRYLPGGDKPTPVMAVPAPAAAAAPAKAG